MRYMAPKKNDRGGSAITLISNQTNRSIHIQLPMLMTWGMSDYTDEKGESDGKFTLSLQFPRDGENTSETDEALEKLKAFEQKLLQDGVTNSKAWFGKQKSEEVVKDNYFSFLKYSKNKETGEPDLIKPPTLRPKVPCYDGKWKVEVFDTTGAQIFPCAENEDATPVEFVPKRSNVMSILQCGGIWSAGGKWGLTWKLLQCVVKPQVMESVLGSGLKIELTSEMKEAINRDIPESSAPAIEEAVVETPKVSEEITTYAEDSDDDEVVPETKVESEPEPKVEVKVESEPEPAPVPKTTVKKKIVKKTK